MDNTSIIISPEKAKTLAVYESDFRSVFTSETDDEITLTFQGEYRMTLKDLRTVFENAIKKDVSADEFLRFWYFPIEEFMDAFGIRKACGWEKDESIFNTFAEEDHDPEYVFYGYHLVRALPLDEEFVFRDIWLKIDEDWCWWGKNSKASQIAFFEESINDINRFYENCKKPLPDKIFTDEEKEVFIRSMMPDGMKTAKKVIEICRSFTDELCEKDNETALGIKAFSLCEGNFLYQRDEKEAEIYIKKLYKVTGGPRHKNVFGNMFLDSEYNSIYSYLS